MGKKNFWKKDGLIGLMIVLLFAAGMQTGPLQRLDGLVFDLGARFSPVASRTDVVVVPVDQPDPAASGQWTWSRSRVADLMDRLHSVKPAAIGLVLPLDTSSRGEVLAYLRGEQAAVYETGFAPAANDAYRVLKRAEADLDVDGRLAAAIKRAGNVVLGVEPALPGRGVPSLPATAALRDFVYPPRPWLNYFQGTVLPLPQALGERLAPAAAFSGAAAGIGPWGADAKRTGVPLVYRYGEQSWPSLPLLLAATARHARMGDMRFSLDDGFSLGTMRISADLGLRAYPRARTAGEASAIRVVQARDLLDGSAQANTLAGKVVLIGLTSAALSQTVTLPSGESVPAVVALAHDVAALINGDTYALPGWTLWAQLALFLAVALLAAFVLPRAGLGLGLTLVLLLAFVTLNVQLVLMLIQSVWLPLAVPLAALVAAFAVIALGRRVRSGAAVLADRLSEANFLLGQKFQEQGQLDRAFEYYRECAPGPACAEGIYGLGLDFERKRQYHKALGVFEYLAAAYKGFRDVDERIRRNREMDNMIIVGKGGAVSATGTLIMDVNEVQKPVLGRYVLERELGRGAMGVVYLGKDPKIGRTVAVKTLALAQEFEGVELEQVKERFYREAETAGRLSHPNIVTVYDVGEEHDVAYMAMDYLKGEPLSYYCRADNLLPIGESLEIIAKVADALAYAHDNNVVHRDIKPANIIYDRDEGSVVVTDFGVACLTDASKTKTGTVLGSPSYMSPEQIAGRKVDGRADQYSLGVTLFQLVTGHLPFTADSLATLMYKIANEKHPSPRKFNKAVPACVSRIINKSLQKAPADRYQSGTQFAETARRCRG